MDTGALDESETLEDRVVKELAKRKDMAEARKHQRVAKRLKMEGAEPGEDVSGITPSITSSTQLLSATFLETLHKRHWVQSCSPKSCNLSSRSCMMRISYKN
jgi:hypothetical protein